MPGNKRQRERENMPGNKRQRERTCRGNKREREDLLRRG